ALEDAARLVPRHRHGDTFKDPGAHEVAHRGAPEVVPDHPGSRLPYRRRPCLPKYRNTLMRLPSRWNTHGQMMPRSRSTWSVHSRRIGGVPEAAARSVSYEVSDDAAARQRASEGKY